MLVFPAPKALETPTSFFESLPTADFQKKMFLMRIAECRCVIHRVPKKTTIKAN
jgi:hypothetical protein